LKTFHCFLFFLKKNQKTEVKGQGSYREKRRHKWEDNFNVIKVKNNIDTKQSNKTNYINDHAVTYVQDKSERQN